jgi:hypothetical protein
VPGVIVVPAPLVGFVEDDVAQYHDMTLDRVVAPVGFGGHFIADKDGLVTSIIKFLQARVCVLDMCHATKHAEVVHD